MSSRNTAITTLEVAMGAVSVTFLRSNNAWLLTEQAEMTLNQRVSTRPESRYYQFFLLTYTR
jgi:hypothetical protein